MKLPKIYSYGVEGKNNKTFIYFMDGNKIKRKKASYFGLSDDHAPDGTSNNSILYWPKPLWDLLSKIKKNDLSYPSPNK